MDAVTCAALSCLQHDKNIVAEVMIVLQMWTEGRYNELLFISDTCQAASLYGSIRSPNIVAMASSKIGKALSLQCKAFSLCCNSHATMPISLQSSHICLVHGPGLDQVFIAYVIIPCPATISVQHKQDPQVHTCIVCMHVQPGSATPSVDIR